MLKRFDRSMGATCRCIYLIPIRHKTQVTSRDQREEKKPDPALRDVGDVRDMGVPRFDLFRSCCGCTCFSFRPPRRVGDDPQFPQVPHLED